MSDLRERIAAVHVPAEEEAAERSWRVVRAAFAAREPAPRRRGASPRLTALALALAAAAAAVGAAATPAGRDAVRELRRAVGVETARPTLASLPAGGRVLLAGPGGAWVVAADGGGRRLGAYVEAAWSPFGRFVVGVAPGRRELVALEPGGDVRWTLARPGPLRLPRWGGSATDTRVAYLSGRSLRVVAGDGTGDRVLAPRVRPVAPAWRPGAGHLLAYVAGGGAVVAADADTGRVRWRARPLAGVLQLDWSGDGRRLLVRGAGGLSVLDSAGRERFELLRRGETAAVAGAAFAGDGVAFVQAARGRSLVWLVPRLVPDGSAARKLFEGAGRLGGPHVSPDGRWLLLPWREADQWLFVRVAGPPRVDGVAGLAARFGGRVGVAGWCCS